MGAPFCIGAAATAFGAGAADGERLPAEASAKDGFSSA